MRQIPLAIATETPRTFESFLAGTNALALAHLAGLGSGSAPVYLWGPSGVGKTHLLHAVALRFGGSGGSVGWFGADVALPWAQDEHRALVVLDDCERLDARQQHAAFALFVEASTLAIPVAAAGCLPPVDLPLRDDLRSRLGWGPVFELHPLGDAEARAVLRRMADGRGIFLPDDVMEYLLTHFARDLKHLVALLDRLDEFGLARKRAITVPLLRQMLADCEARPE